jgi:hypothetical protein
LISSPKKRLYFFTIKLKNMKKTKWLLGGSILLVVMLFLISCQKELADGSSANANVAKVNSWVETQKAAVLPGKVANIELLKANLNFSGLKIEKSNDNEQLLIVPVKDNFKTLRNISEKTNVKLVLIIDKEGKVRKGNIVQYTPPNGQASNDIPDNTFYNIFNTAESVSDGQFRFLSVTGRWLYQLDYKDGKMQSYGIIQPGSAGSNTGTSRTNTCLDWYLIITYYLPDGTTYQTREYIGTTCDGCGSTMNQTLCPDDNGGGNSESYEFAVARDVNWKVADNPESLGTGSGIYSHERLKGKRVAGETFGGHFTSNSFHYWSDCNFCSSSNPYDVWWETFAYLSATGGSAASCRVEGRLQYKSVVSFPVNTKTWAFNEVF